MNEPEIVWRKSSFSGPTGECVEVARAADAVLVRDSKRGAESPVLRYTGDEWQVYVDALAAEQLGTYCGPVILVRFDEDWWEMWRDGAPRPSLTFFDGEVAAFVAGVRNGEFTLEALGAGDGRGGDAPGSGSDAALSAP
ncbi:DUF397 domain-containing protein [Nonomuraea sp. NPDC059194]|uniref:DUF397 domain-containing protein n=1 Tax=Nonomuraea sp. NPDC059194 TaxID=3346764 RepID=UPI003674BE43